MASNKNHYEGINHIVEVNSNVEKGCDHCDFWLEKFTESVNHYITEHGYKLLHVGTQTIVGPKEVP